MSNNYQYKANNIDKNNNVITLSTNKSSSHSQQPLGQSEYGRKDQTPVGAFFETFLYVEQ